MYIGLDLTGQGCEDETIHVRNLLAETPVKNREKGTAAGEPSDWAIVLTPVMGEKKQRIG